MAHSLRFLAILACLFLWLQSLSAWDQSLRDFPRLSQAAWQGERCRRDLALQQNIKALLDFVSQEGMPAVDREQLQERLVQWAEPFAPSQETSCEAWLPKIELHQETNTDLPVGFPNWVASWVVHREG